MIYIPVVLKNYYSKVKFIVPQDKITADHDNKNNSGVSFYLQEEHVLLTQIPGNLFVPPDSLR